MDLVFDCSFLLSSGSMSSSCATLKFVVWFRDYTRKSMILHLLWHVWKNFPYLRLVKEGPGTYSFRFPFVCWWSLFFESALHKFSACPIPRSECRGRFDDTNSTHYRSFWLWNVDQTSREPSLWSHFRPFLTCKVFQNEVRLPHTQGHQKLFMPLENLCPRYSMLSISPF